MRELAAEAGEPVGQRRLGRQGRRDGVAQHRRGDGLARGPRQDDRLLDPRAGEVAEHDHAIDRARQRSGQADRAGSALSSAGGRQHHAAMERLALQVPGQFHEGGGARRRGRGGSAEGVARGHDDDAAALHPGAGSDDVLERDRAVHRPPLECVDGGAELVLRERGPDLRGQRVVARGPGTARRIALGDRRHCRGDILTVERLRRQGRVERRLLILQRERQNDQSQRRNDQPGPVDARIQHRA